MHDQINQRLAILATRPFRASFHLGSKEQAIVADKGMEVIRQHAADLIARRLAPAHPAKDGKQTPYRGHPVFVAQHATATCCRNCLLRWHRLPKGQELTAAEQDYVVEVIMIWIGRESRVAE